MPIVSPARSSQTDASRAVSASEAPCRKVGRFCVVDRKAGQLRRFPSSLGFSFRPASQTVSMTRAQREGVAVLALVLIVVGFLIGFGVGAVCC